MASFLHGAEVIEVQTGRRPIQTVRTSVIGIVGTAPDSEPAAKAQLLLGSVPGNNAVLFEAVDEGLAGNRISIVIARPEEADQPLSVTTNGTAITISLATDEDGEPTSTATHIAAALAGHPLVVASVPSGSTGSGIFPVITRPAFLTGGVDEAFPLDTPVLVAGNQAEAARLGRSGTLPAAIDDIFKQAGAVCVVVRVEEGADADETALNIIGGVDPSGQYTGARAFLAAETKTGVRPMLLIAPGFTPELEVAQGLLSVADRLLAHVIIEGPDATDEAAIAYRDSFGTRRAYIVDPGIKTGSGIRPNSGIVAGLIAKVDNEKGFHWSPSNQELTGLTDTTRPIDFTFGDPNCRANLLNEREIATIIRSEGFRLWGNRTCSSDPKFAFLCVSRVQDILSLSILRAHQWATDRPITRTYLSDIAEEVTAYMARLKSQGIIAGGRCWPDPDLNTPESIATGRVYFNIDWTPSYPAERITFRMALVNDYLEELTA